MLQREGGEGRTVPSPLLLAVVLGGQMHVLSVEAWHMHRPPRLPFCINRSHRGAILALPTAQPLWSPCPLFSLHAGFLICSTCWSYFHSVFLDLN